jgi:hypothetical protein
MHIKETNRRIEKNNKNKIKKQQLLLLLLWLFFFLTTQRVFETIERKARTACSRSEYTI